MQKNCSHMIIPTMYVGMTLGVRIKGPKNPWAKKTPGPKKPRTFFVVSSHEICQGFFGPKIGPKKPWAKKSPNLGQKTHVMKRSQWCYDIFLMIQGETRCGKFRDFLVLFCIFAIDILCCAQWSWFAKISFCLSVMLAHHSELATPACCKSSYG